MQPRNAAPVPLWLFRGDILQLEIGCSPGTGLGTVPSSARLEPCKSAYSPRTSDCCDFVERKMPALPSEAQTKEDAAP